MNTTEQAVPSYIDSFVEAFASDSEITPIVEQIIKHDDVSGDNWALLLEALPIEQRLNIWALLNHELQQTIFIAMRDESRKIILTHLSDEDSYRLLQKLDADELLNIAESLPDHFMDYALSKMDSRQREFFATAMNYSEDQIGHWQSFDTIRVTERMRIKSVKRIVNRNLPKLTEAIYVVNKSDELLGQFDIKKLFFAADDSMVSEYMDHDIASISATTPTQEAVDRLINTDITALPIIDGNNILLGRLDIANAHILKEEEKDQIINQSGGLSDDEDLFSSVWRSSQTRAFWLGINLLTAFLASAFIGLFQGTLEQVVALAVLMPVVASMGGISGSQTLTLIVRGSALGQITDTNRKLILAKELKVGAINGVFWAFVIGLVTLIFFQSFYLCLTIAAAILINLMTAPLSGVVIPWVLERFNLDPALSGSVILTTVTDIVGFVAFLGIGTLILL